MSTLANTHTDKKRQDFYDRLAPRNLAPLWVVLTGLVPHEPNKGRSLQWKYEELRPLLMESGELLTAEEAEPRASIYPSRRVPSAHSASRARRD
jgi:gentisate 1,2-dioxygenase